MFFVRKSSRRFCRNDDRRLLRGNGQRTNVMPFSGNALAKYLVMGSQVIAWCTVSAMLLRRGLNQVNGVAQEQQPSYDKTDGTAVDGRYVNVTAATDANRHHETTKSFDNNGTPAVVAGVIMITIAVIMLIISPTIMLMKIIEKRRRRILDAVSARY